MLGFASFQRKVFYDTFSMQNQNLFKKRNHNNVLVFHQNRKRVYFWMTTLTLKAVSLTGICEFFFGFCQMHFLDLVNS